MLFRSRQHFLQLLQLAFMNEQMSAFAANLCRDAVQGRHQRLMPKSGVRLLERLQGALVLGGIHMSPIPTFDYALVYGERIIRSVANNTRTDGREFLQEAAQIPIRTHVETFPLAHANEALAALKHDAIRGAGVLLCG